MLHTRPLVLACRETKSTSVACDENPIYCFSQSSATWSGLFQMKQEINGRIIAKFTTEQKGSLDTFLTSFPQAYDIIFSVLIFQFKGVWNCLFFKRVRCNCPPPGGGGEGRDSTKFYTGTLRFEVQPLNLLFPCYCLVDRKQDPVFATKGTPVVCLLLPSATSFLLLPMPSA